MIMKQVDAVLQCCMQFGQDWQVVEWNRFTLIVFRIAVKLNDCFTTILLHANYNYEKEGRTKEPIVFKCYPLHILIQQGCVFS